MQDKKISFCTTCKGRLWQLSQTLPYNIAHLDENSELVLLDYQSDDGLKYYIFSEFKEELESGILKYFYLNHNYNFTMSYAKNVIHKLASGDILFNLDADNLLYFKLLEELRSLNSNEILVPHIPKNKKPGGSFGRLGYYKDLFYLNNGYNESIVGMKADDHDFIQRAIKNFKSTTKQASKEIQAIQNTRYDKDRYVDISGFVNPPINYPDEWGKAELIDYRGNLIKI